jgi:hypothetical protein
MSFKVSFSPLPLQNSRHSSALIRQNLHGNINDVTLLTAAAPSKTSTSSS